ncbi:MAG: hypothetical protein LBQ90_05245 [Synergistaceae bacterium]|jgi:uncharacterized protein YfaS (alpha-2-macroglobulin family)|nr:hypothetical protein [Synergistaceae bacterium]
MQIKKWMGALLFLWLVLPGPLSAEAASKSGVASFVPVGKVANNVAFRVVFTEAVAPKDVIGKSLGVPDFPFTVTPAIQAEGRWLDNRTFSASLLAPLDMATVYSVTVRDDLKNLRGRRIEGGNKYTFQTDPPSLVSLRATNSANGTVNMRLEFNMPVSPSRLQGFLKVTRGREGIPVSFRTEGQRAEKTLSVTLWPEASGRQSSLQLNVRIAAGLTGEVGTLGFPKDVAHTLEIRPSLRVEGLQGDRNGIRVDTNFGVDLQAAKNFISVEPETPFTLDSWYSGMFYMQGNFKPRQRFLVTFKKGLPSNNNGAVLEEDHTQAVIMPDLEPSINLAAPGTFLSPLDGGRVPIELVNLKKLQVGIWRLYENNIPYTMRNTYSYESYSFPRDLARRVYYKEFSLSLPLNEVVRRVLPLDEMVSGDRGLFLLTLANPGEDYWDERAQVINLSDMGLVARLWEDGILVWVNTLSSLQPIADANVRLYSAANQVLAEGKTDADGLWVLKRDAVWSGADMTPALVTVTKDNDVTFVRLTRGLMSQGIFDTSGRPWLRSGYDAALFSARGIYRPGEQAPFRAIVRTHDLKTPEPFPVLFAVYDPLGRTVSRGTDLLTPEGGALFNMNIPGNALTGEWSISLYIPGNENQPLARMSFSVEDFAPPRIEVKINTDAAQLTSEESAGFDLAARYLFGVDGAGLKWEAHWNAREENFVPKKPQWRGYTFGDPTRRFAGAGEMIGEGTLDDTGAARFELSLPDAWKAPSLINVTVVGRVMEEGGRWVSESVSLPFCPTPFLLGLALAEGPLAVGRDMTFPIAAVTPDRNENPADPGELTAELFRVTWNYNLVRVDGYTRWQSTEEYTKIDAQSVTLTNGVGQVTFRPPRWGSYMVRVADATDDARASLRFYADDPGYADRGGSQLLDRVEIEMDKETYRVGETAKISLRAPFEGLMLFSVEAADLIDRKILKIAGGETVVEVPVTEKMTPNAWCTAWLIRPVTKEDSDTTHRAAGVARLMADTGKYRLNVGLSAPEKTDPAAKLSVAVTLADAEGKPAKGELSLALVDDGVLRLTGFKTPDLLAHFLGARRLNSEGYDIYDLLMPIESHATELLHPAGGSALDAFTGGGRAQRFKILSLFEGVLSADERGVVSVDLDLPEFSGRGRLFAVAVSGSRFGSAERNVQIARDIVTEVDLPRFAAPGDVFRAPLTVYNSGEVSKDVELRLSTSEELLSADVRTLKAVVPAKGSSTWPVTLTAKKPGSALYSVTTVWKDGEAEKSSVQDIDLPVRSPFPVLTLSGSGLFSSGDTTIALPKDAFAGPIQGKLTLADTPLVDLTKATTFLTHYPYGCLEQTLSSAWPFLILPDALKEIDPLLVDDESVRRKTDAAIIRIQAMQLYDGSFSAWPGNGYAYDWGSVYATHFLVEARKAGVDYPQGMLQAALSWLKQYLASLPGNNYRYRERDDFTTKAYAAYVLALNGEKPLGWLHYLKENRDGMWPSGRIWLAGATALIEGRADALRELGTWGGNDALVPEALYRTLESNVRNTAQLLSIWTEVEPRSAEAMRLVQMLLDWGRQNRWYSTQENSAVAMALGRHLSRAGYEKGALEGTLANDGQPLASFRSGQKLALNVPDLPPSENPLTLSLAGTGSGYYAWAVTGTPVRAPEPAREGLLLDSVWTDRDGNVIDPKQPIGQGTEIRVTLTLTPLSTVSNLAVSFLLPAGMEIENPRLKGNEEEEQRGVRSDVRDDRLLLFVDSLSRKTNCRFTMRAVTRGAFALPPLAAEGMYDPGIRFVGEMEENIVID